MSATEADRLFLIEKRLEHIGSLIHGIWMAGLAIDGQPEREAIRDMAHHTGESLDEIIREVRECSVAAEAAAKPVKMTGGQRRG